VRQRWATGPDSITLIRHGESVGNVADARAHAERAEALQLDLRDADVPLSDQGREQARALGEALRDRGIARPDVVVSSPYRRAAETAELAMAELGLVVDVDERLRERGLGWLDGLTGAGVRARFPEEAARRSRIGKFYYQPPGGESWADVALRVRSFLRDLCEQTEGRRVWLFTHQAVILAHRFVLLDLTEEQVLEVDRSRPLPNTSCSEFVRDGDGYRLVTYADTTLLETAGTEPTHESPKDEEASR
jgi:broad specificity phosphatase PhoE